MDPKRLIIAVVLSVGVLVTWSKLMPPPGRGMRCMWPDEDAVEAGICGWAVTRKKQVPIPSSEAIINDSRSVLSTPHGEDRMVQRGAL